LNKNCFTIKRHPRTGEEIEVHAESELLRGPEVVGDNLIYAQFVCVHCGYVTDWVKQSSLETVVDDLRKAEASKPKSRHWKASLDPMQSVLLKTEIS
jgi:hypothetical protein